MRITVFTPTYNRCYTLEKLYNSLQCQTFMDFEWIVVDDGSTDNTSEFFEKIKNDSNFFDVNYIKTENGGKHRAINKGVQLAKGELFLIVDSDDYLTDSALEIIDKIEKEIPKNGAEYYAGVCGLRGHVDGTMLGTSFAGDYLDITVLERTRNGINGDKAEVFYTSLLKEYPFPEFDDEKFVTEAVVWDRIAFDGYKLRFFNEIVVICEYRPDGLTAQGESLLYNNPKGYGLYLYQCGQYGKLFGVRKWNEYLTFYYKLRDKYNFFQIAGFLKIPSFVLWFRLLGLRLFYKLYDR